MGFNSLTDSKTVYVALEFVIVSSSKAPGLAVVRCCLVGVGLQLLLLLLLLLADFAGETVITRRGEEVADYFVK
jgi:hypothetical protein